MSFSLCQEELVRLFRKICIRKISTYLQIQQHRTFEEVISQAKVIEGVMVQNGEIKVLKKENNNWGYGSNKSSFTNGSKPQFNQLMLQASPPPPMQNFQHANQINVPNQYYNQNKSHGKNQN